MATVIYTDVYRADIARIYRNSLRRFGIKAAVDTMGQIKAAEQRLRAFPGSGTLDPEHHSTRFRFLHIRNSHKIFFEIDGDRVYMITAGHDRRDWVRVLSGLEGYADAQMSAARAH